MLHDIVHVQYMYMYMYIHVLVSCVYFSWDCKVDMYSILVASFPGSPLCLFFLGPHINREGEREPGIFLPYDPWHR